jgi:hypothetical protein
VTLAIGTNPSSGTLSGCTQSGETAGVVSFTGCKINKSGTGYTLTATDASDSLNTASAPSNPFNITVGAPASLSFSTQPSTSATGGTAFTSQPQVTVLDAGGNPVTTSPVTLTITSGTGTNGAALTCTTNPVSTNSSGVAIFAGCKINKSGTGYTLTATDGSVTNASNPFNITVGSAAQLAFTTQPGGGTGGTVWGTQPVVTVEDAGGNTVTTDSSTVTLAIGTNPSSGTLSGCTQSGETAGVVSFTGCKINRSGTGYTLTATDASDSLNTASAPSNPFNIS